MQTGGNEPFDIVSERRRHEMNKRKGLKAAHSDKVNSMFVSFEASVVISVSDDSIRIWDTVNGVELYQASDKSETDRFVVNLGPFNRDGSLRVA